MLYHKHYPIRLLAAPVPRDLSFSKIIKCNLGCLAHVHKFTAISTKNYCSLHNCNFEAIKLFILASSLLHYSHVCFVSSVRSSYSQPNLLLIQHPPTHFFRSHRSSILDFHFLSHYSNSYIKGNHLTYLLTHEYLMGTTGYHCKIVQDSAR